MESLAGIETTTQLEVERAIALEMERIAITPAILPPCVPMWLTTSGQHFCHFAHAHHQATQSWCGNRLGKSMIRVGGSLHPFTNELRNDFLKVLLKFEKPFVELAHQTYRMPSVENRFDEIGAISEEQARKIGAVGMVARMANVKRDIRQSHPSRAYIRYLYDPIVLPRGDVFSRFLLRRKEIKKSLAWLRDVLNNEDFLIPSPAPPTEIKLNPSTLAISLTEGWRGEICHAAVTDSKGKLVMYKIKDPSMHNWKALELSLRNLEISDFPINNKSYNLSYCGYDL
jgi:Ni,Fe-hydrogenase III large subunit